jgi:hypothetical protein
MWFQIMRSQYVWYNQHFGPYNMYTQFVLVFPQKAIIMAKLFMPLAENNLILSDSFRFSIYACS